MAAPLEHFHLFPDLPAELRYEIWRHALPDPVPEVLVFGTELNCAAFRPDLHKTYGPLRAIALADLGPSHLGIPDGPPVVETAPLPLALLLACREAYTEARRAGPLRTLHRADGGGTYRVPTRAFVPGFDALYVHNLGHGVEDSAWLHRVFLGVWLPHVLGGRQQADIAVPPSITEPRGLSTAAEETAGLHETLFSLPLTRLTGVLRPGIYEAWCPRDGRVPAQRRYRLEVVDAFTVPGGGDDEQQVPPPAGFGLARFCLGSGRAAARARARMAEGCGDAALRRRLLGPLRVQVAVLGLCDRPSGGWW